MTSTQRAINDLVDMVEAEPGWRVESTARGWQVFPPDKSAPIIQASAFTNDMHAAKNFEAQLRRAGFPPLLRKRVIRSTDDMPAPVNGKPAQPTVPAFTLIPEPPAPTPRDLIREARTKIQTALDALASIDTLLGEIEGERGQFQKFKELVSAMLK